MKKKLIAVAAILLSMTATAQQQIKIEELSQHIGDSVTVCKKIYGGIFLEKSKGTPTFLNAGGSYPDAPLTIVIWPAAREQFATAPEVFYKNKEVCISGKVILYKDKPEIVVYNEKQLVVK
jgi:hypothetical protein